MQLLFEAKSELAFFQVLTEIAEELGFNYCAYGMRILLPLSQPKVIMRNNYPLQWQQRYEHEGYLMLDPTVAHAKRSTLPLLWSDFSSANHHLFWEDARAHGLHSGWAQSCRDANGTIGLLTLARSDENITFNELRKISLQLTWLAQAAHEGILPWLAGKYKQETVTQLTAREIEVLRWSADGKTAEEVSRIMSISDRTVNFHISNALKKLNSTNKISAAIKATVFGIL